MKVKFYFAVIILASLVFGFSFGYLITNEQENVAKISNIVISDQFIYEEFLRFENDIYQYFISVDLILGSGETYLINGARKKAELLLNSVDKFKGYRDLFNKGTLLDEINRNIRIVHALIEKAQNIQAIERESEFNSLLQHSDVVTQQLIYLIQETKVNISKIADARKQQLIEKQQTAQHYRLISAFLFGTILIVLWIWSYKRVCNPILNLKLLAEKSMQSFNNLTIIEKGPKEIIELSNSLASLTNTLNYQASHDSLTQLFNRREFERKLSNCIDEIKVDSKKNYDILCYLDLDQFKIVNDTCGHIAGDELLKIIATTIQDSIRNSDFLARVGGDEFCILLYKCDRETALEICNKIRNDIENIRYTWDEKVFRISVSIGITEIDGVQTNAQDVLNAADTACSVAKDLGRNRVHAFNASDTQLARKRSEMSCINQIHLALEEDRFILYRQDIVPVNPRNIEKQHFEVLVRMIARDNSIISPYAFLPTAERYHLATKIDKWVVSNVCRTLSENPLQIDDIEFCNINLSGQSFSDKNMADYIIECLIKSKVPANKICFEITETAAVTDINNAKIFIGKLKKFGCSFALDDFGSGLSSFQYLKDLPVDFVKIDGSFVKNLAIDHFDLATVKSINDIAKASGKLTVAEFVEDKDIVKKLREIGIDFAQGYYFDKPIPLNQSFEFTQKASNW